MAEWGGSGKRAKVLRDVPVDANAPVGHGVIGLEVDGFDKFPDGSLEGFRGRMPLRQLNR